MRLATQFLQAQMQRMCGRERIAPNCDASAVNPGSNRSRTTVKFASSWARYAFVGMLMILISLAPAVFAQQEAVTLGSAAGETTEYCSTDTPKDIPDRDTITSSLTVSDSGAITDLNVRLNITHRWNSNLDIYLIAPDGTRVELLTDVGGMSRNLVDTVLDDEAAESIVDGTGPFTGSFRPEGSLADFIGKDISGTWILDVTDDSSGDVGTLNSWCLIATVEVKEPLASPVILSQASTPGGIRDVVSWSDLGQTREYSSTAVENIPGEGTLTQTLTVDDVGMIEDLDVKVNINHEWDSELNVYLIAPDGTRVELFSDVGGSQDNFIDTILDDQSSVSITAGTAPFTGRYRPEGSLGSLVGKDINGQWKLEVTDDSWYGSGKVNSWSLIANVADVLYYVECATDAGFTTVVANSGWTSEQSHTFTALDPEKQHWYRAKARPLKTWCQTSQTDFGTDVLTATETRASGDVVLAAGGGGGQGPEVSVIQNPGFEDGGGWWMSTNSIFLALDGLMAVPGDIIWASEGKWSAGAMFWNEYSYKQGDYGDFYQSVDWTGVNTLVFDYCTLAAGKLKCKVLIGNTEVWSKDGTNSGVAVYNDVAIDVSSFTGQQDLKLRVEVKSGGSFDAAILWDNLRTYGPSRPSAGTVVSTPIALRSNDKWDVLGYDATMPAGTQLTVDVLPETGSNPFAGYGDVLTGTDLSKLSAGTIRLRANLSTSDPEATPVLQRWSLGYSEAARESGWSNVASSLP